MVCFISVFRFLIFVARGADEPMRQTPVRRLTICNLQSACCTRASGGNIEARERAATV